MYRRFRMQNFRCFRDLTVEPLERVNLVAGQNNVGKTALLEALFLHLGPANLDLPLTINALRGIERSKAAPEELWGWLFGNKEIEATIELSAMTDGGEQRTLSIQLGRSRSYSVRPDANGLEPPVTTAPAPRELVLTYQNGGSSSVSRATIAPDGAIRKEEADIGQLPPALFFSARSRGAEQDAERFSRLERVGRQMEILEPLRRLEPRLQRLAVLVTGGAAMVNGDIGIGEMIPVPLMGEGTGRLLSILLAIVANRDGIVLVDEIENGFHYKVMQGVWRAISQAARRANAQVIATTHSWECIGAAHAAFTHDDVYDFRLHRLDSVDGGIELVGYDREALGAALEVEMEVR